MARQRAARSKASKLARWPGDAGEEPSPGRGRPDCIGVATVSVGRSLRRTFLFADLLRRLVDAVRSRSHGMRGFIHLWRTCAAFPPGTFLGTRHTSAARLVCAASGTSDPRTAAARRTGPTARGVIAQIIFGRQAALSPPRPHRDHVRQIERPAPHHNIGERTLRGGLPRRSFGRSGGGFTVRIRRPMSLAAKSEDGSKLKPLARLSRRQLRGLGPTNASRGHLVSPALRRSRSTPGKTRASRPMPNRRGRGASLLRFGVMQ